MISLGGRAATHRRSARSPGHPGRPGPGPRLRGKAPPFVPGRFFRGGRGSARNAPRVGVQASAVRQLLAAASQAVRSFGGTIRLLVLRWRPRPFDFLST